MLKVMTGKYEAHSWTIKKSFRSVSDQGDVPASEAGVKNY